MRRLVFSLVVLSVTLATLPPVLAQKTPAEQVASQLRWRSVGPARGGRSVACAGSKARPNEYYFGATGGGIWKTEDGGIEWRCVSDGFLGTASVGALAVAADNPDVVYAGMGEKDIRGNISHGDGLYKTTDGGKTWTSIGLKETQTISRIVLDPRDSNTLYVAALGHVYGPNRERGLYKSTDGGSTWSQILFESERAGAIDVEIDPFRPDTVYCATWEAWRTPYTMNSGGPGSKLWKSTDGGKTWKDLSRTPGMPDGILGKIGVSPSPVKPGRVWAIVEAHEGGLFVSDDGGGTWRRTSADRNYRQRAWYYTHVIADPADADTVYVLNVSMGKSTDGGKTFRGMIAGHSDHHDLWIAPDNPKRMISSNDGGGAVSTDGGSSWTEQDYPTAQFYHVSTDNAWPYRILGAQQDNSTVRIVSTARPRGRTVGPSDWTATAGGESGYVVAKPDNPDIVYGGSYGGELEMLDHRTNQRRSVNAWPDLAMGRAAIDLDERFQWTFPIVFSPHDPNMLYCSSQHIFKSLNGGETWTKISPDLTRNDPRTLQSSGGPITKDNTSVEYYGTVFTLAESPVRPGTIWAGSDDGLVHVSTDAGGSWQRVTPKEMPEWGLCSMVDASAHDAGTAYLAVDNHENDDHRPYIFRTYDHGKTWKKIVDGIPEDDFIRVVREDPSRPGLLFAGSERRVYVSLDAGEHWFSVQNNLPLTPVHDLVFKNGDVVVATHGRSFWVLDDMTPLRQATSLKAEAPFLFRPRESFRPGGIAFSYYLPKDADKVALEVFDEEGVVVSRGSGVLETGAGLQRQSASLSYPGFRGFPGMVLWGAGGRSIPAPPGRYTIRLTVDGKTLTETIRYRVNPNSTSSEADAKAQATFARRVAARTQEANDAVVAIRSIKKKVAELKKGDAKIDVAAQTLVDRLSGIEGEIYQVRNQSGQDPLNYPVKLNNRLGALLGEILSGDFRPNDQSYVVFAKLSDLLQVQLDALSKVLKEDLGSLNTLLKGRGIEAIAP
ncbi:MAG TPA: hypothetical protein PLH94_01345 [Fimbriimonadaceae bacterium]|nr:hypothetical protein [Fimbriimonadaceae bacterium]